MDYNDLMLYFYHPEARLEGLGLAVLNTGESVLARISPKVMLLGIWPGFDTDLYLITSDAKLKTVNRNTLLAYFPAAQMQAYARVVTQGIILLEMP